MKYILTESQVEKLDAEKKADVIYRLLKSVYPENYESVDSNDDIDVYDNEKNENLLFYYRFDEDEIYVGLHFINSLFEITKIPFLDYDEVKHNEREMFNKIMKIFAKKYFGWDVKYVYFHWY